MRVLPSSAGASRSTGRRLRAENVSGPTKRSASPVSATCTPKPAFTQQTGKLTRAVGGDSARDSEQNRRPGWGRRRRQVAAGSSHSIFPAASSSSAMVR